MLKTITLDEVEFNEIMKIITEKDEEIRRLSEVIKDIENKKYVKYKDMFGYENIFLHNEEQIKTFFDREYKKIKEERDELNE